MSNKIGNIDNNIKELLDNPFEYANKISIDHLVEILKKLDYQYYNTDKPLVPDSVYDLLTEVLEKRDPKNKYLQKVGAAPISKTKVSLPYPMASLDKIKPDTDVLNKWKKEYTGPYVLSDKLDGVSGLLYKKDNQFKLYTRGDATTGQDITHLIPYVLKDKLKSDKIPNNSAIRGELIISKKNFEKIKDKFANARNTVAGLVNSKNYSIEVAKLTEFIGYAIIHPKMKAEDQMNKLKDDWSFPTVTYRIEKEIDNKMLGDYLKKRRAESIYEIDGIVVIDSSKTYDTKNTNPEYGFAFKMALEDQIATTRVIDIEWNVTMHGYLKPTVKIEPVKLTGVTIKNATAFNAKYVVDNVLGPGAVIKIIRSGDVIPHILEVIKPATSKTPKLPDVPYKWNKTGIDLIVQDIHGVSKDEIIIKQITHFFKVLGVKHISEGIVTKLVEHGYNTIPKVITADFDKLKEIDGIGTKLLSKIYENIRVAFETTNLETIMAASNILGRGMGVKRMGVITKAYPNIMNEKWDKKQLKDKILELEGFDEITASQIADNFEKFKKFFAELEKIDKISVGQLKTPKKTAKPSGKLFVDQKVVFTGFRNKDWEKFIQDNGGQITGTVSKNTALLVHATGEDSSSKDKKAKDLGVKTMSSEEFAEKYKV